MQTRAALFVLCGLLALPGRAFSQSTSPPAFNKEGGYVGFSLLPDFTFDNDHFDGQSIYQQVDGDETVILPRVNSAPLLRFALGYRTKRVGIEVSYDRSQHDATFANATGRATFQALNADGRLYFLSHRRVQPYIQFGGTLPWFTVEDGASLEGQVSDAKFKGLGLNAQGGVLVYPHRRLGISVGYNFHLVQFETVKGVSGTDFDLIPTFKETRGMLVVGGHVIF